MAFSGYLIKIGNTVLPMKYMKAESYKSTPSQRLETEAKRAITGLLHRTTVEHRPTKIEFETPIITNLDLQAMWNIIQANYTIENERKITIQYYNEETDSYLSAECYIPDVEYQINRIDLATNLIYYNPIRFAFIEY